MTKFDTIYEQIAGANKAYVLVHREPYEGDTIYGVYSTAQHALEAQSLAAEGEIRGGAVDGLVVLEVGVDQEPDWNSADVLKK